VRPTGVRFSVVAAVAATLLVAGCTSDGSGSVSGVVHIYGGPTSPTSGKPFNTGQPAPGQDVVVEDSHGNRTTVTSDATGRYQLSLPPGRYTLMCGPDPKFTIRSGVDTTVDCALAVA
jgi:hypothetical protein